MKYKNAIILSIIAIIFLLMINIVNAAETTLTLATPASSAKLTGTVILNATASQNTGNFSCLFYAKSASTANSSWTNIATYENNTGLSVNTTFNSAGLEDSNDYSFNATCGNDTKQWVSVVNTGIRIDNTVPTAASSLAFADNYLQTSAGTQTFSGTVNDAQTTGCTLYIGINGGSMNSYTMTYSTTSCSYDYTGFTDSSINENYFWYIQASDGTNTTNSATRVFQVQIPPSAGGIANNAQLDKVKEQQTLAIGQDLFSTDKNNIIVVIIGLLIIIAIIYFVKK